MNHFGDLQVANRPYRPIRRFDSIINYRDFRIKEKKSKLKSKHVAFIQRQCRIGLNENIHSSFGSILI